MLIFFCAKNWRAKFLCQNFSTEIGTEIGVLKLHCQICANFHPKILKKKIPNFYRNFHCIHLHIASLTPPPRHLPTARLHSFGISIFCAANTHTLNKIIAFSFIYLLLLPRKQIFNVLFPVPFFSPGCVLFFKVGVKLWGWSF